MKDRHAYAVAQLDRLQGFYPRAEGKASFLLAIDLAMLASVANSLPVKELASPRGALGVMAAALLSYSLLHVFRTFFPHLDPAARRSIFYFGDIAKEDCTDFTRRVANITDGEVLDDLLNQVWRNSEILEIKYKSVERAFRFLAVAIIPWALFLFAMTVRAGKLPVLGSH